MQDAKINVRLKNILQRICNESDYVTITAIAKDLGVSGKTVLRELPAVEKWLERKGWRLDKKTGVGIRVNGSLEERKNIMRLLGQEIEEKFYTPRERQIIIISELLQNQEPVKLYSFTGILKVTEGTISNDLDKAEEWFKKYEITLVRKQGLGVYIEGEEKNIRKCMINLIYENTDDNHLLGLIRNNISKVSVPVNGAELIIRSRLLNLIDGDILKNLETLVHNAEERIGYKLADSAYVGLIVHLAIAIQRIGKKEDIRMEKPFLEELKSSREYSIAERLALDMEAMFDLRIPEDEIGYITMHIKGSKNRDTGEKDMSKTIGNFELVKLSKEMIKLAENETGRFLAHNERLLIGLVNHLGPTISRLKMNLEIRNPLLEEIKEYYPHLLKVARKCVAVVEKYIGIKMPESEIAYIAMHLGAAIETSEAVPKRIYRAAIACATGIGTSRLLATRIEKEYEHIQIVDVISTLHIEEKWLREKGVEFIISTVGMEESSVPVVVVNPLVFEEDKTRIENLLSSLKNTASPPSASKRKTLQLREKISVLNDYGKAIMEVLDHFFLQKDSASESIQDMIHEASRIVAQDTAKAEKLASALKAREEKGSTFITGHGVLLLHCRTDAVDALHFGVIKVDRELYCINGREEEEKVVLGVIMLAPETCNKNFMETISHVSKMLIERPAFTKLLKNGTKDEAFYELSAILEEFYKHKCSKYMEG